jgi:hypothetical protein
MKKAPKAESKNIPQPKAVEKKSTPVVEDDYEEEFETYDDDFEDEPPAVIVPVKKAAPAYAPPKQTLNDLQSSSQPRRYSNWLCHYLV